MMTTASGVVACSIAQRQFSLDKARQQSDFIERLDDSVLCTHGGSTTMLPKRLASSLTLEPSGRSDTIETKTSQASCPIAPHGPQCLDIGKMGEEIGSEDVLGIGRSEA